MGIIEPILPNLVDFNKVLVHFGAIISWSCHNEPRLCCYWGKIGKIVPVVLITTLHVTMLPKRLQNRSFWVFCFVFNWTQWIWKVAHCFRAPNSLQTYLTYLKTNTLVSLLIQWIIEIVHFHTMPTPDLGRHRKSEWVFVALRHWTVIAAPKCMIFYLFQEKSSD